MANQIFDALHAAMQAQAYKALGFKQVARGLLHLTLDQL